ncbi:MFS transporter [Flavobacterium branchiophilum]|uniref:Major facilitator superfamily (MFS) permease n=1 Tax=Flavobacterium branchiophilum (strain FL-15) TaxID=1034807 RepID=G2Z553_FLABF|nr:MFS transporter [Flavobacterium branchiophilum]CCB68559.1 Major facilitator superfamily (MFS) permease [Flavobacterium branchiophilum FL-15]
MKIKHTQIVPFALFLITLAVNISMPLFRPYAKLAGLSNGQTALVLATYIFGMIPCYVFLGGISDRLGRKPILLISLFCALISDVIITLYPNVFALIAARFFQGVALGLSMGTGTAYLTELYLDDPQATSKAANAASLSTAFGFSGGAFMTSIALLIYFDYQPITYFIAITITVIGLILAFKLPHLKPIGGSIIRLPYFPKGYFPINLSIAICWATTGVVIAIVPSKLAQFGYAAYAGFCLVLINWTGAFLQKLIRKHFSSKTSLKIGFGIIPLGFAFVVLGCYLEILPVVLLGTAIIGSGAYGFSYLGGLALIATLGGVQRARAVSGYMLFGYIGFGIPAIFLGYLADIFGIVPSLFGFEIIIVLLSLYLYIIFDK